MDPYGSHTVMEEGSSIFLPCVQYKEDKKKPYIHWILWVRVIAISFRQRSKCYYQKYIDADHHFNSALVYEIAE